MMITMGIAKNIMTISSFFEFSNVVCAILQGKMLRYVIHENCYVTKLLITM